MDCPYLNDPVGLSAAERAAWQRGDYPTADLLGALMDLEDRVDPAELADMEDEQDKEERRAIWAEERVGILEFAADATYHLLDDLRQQIETAKRVSERDNILAKLKEAQAALVGLD